jgi:hypothetical protein
MTESKGSPMQSDPYRPWRLAVFAVVVGVTVAYVALVAFSILLAIPGL